MWDLFSVECEVASLFILPFQRSFVFFGEKDFIIYRLGLVIISL